MLSSGPPKWHACSLVGLLLLDLRMSGGPPRRFLTLYGSRWAADSILTRRRVLPT